MGEGAECYPYSPNNLMEALANIPAGRFGEIAERWGFCRKHGMYSGASPAALLYLLDNHVTDYWREMARHVAGKRVD